MDDQSTDPRQFRRVTSGKKRRAVRAMRQNADKQRTHLLAGARKSATRPSAR